MPTKAYVVRVGGLAVALAVGAAVVSGWSGGIAWADDSPGPAGSSSSSNTTPSVATTGTNGAMPKHGPKHSAPPGVVVSTGDPTDDSAPISKSPHPSKTATPPVVSANEDQPTKPAKPKGPDRPDAKPSKTSTPDRVSAVAGAAHDAMLPANVDRLTTAIADPPERSRAAVSVRPAPTQISPIAVPTPPAPSPPNLIGVVSQLVSGVVNAILSPFIATNAPGAPAGAPAMWALLAFVRREFESAVRFLFPGAAPAVPQTTSQTLAAGTGEPEQRTLILSAFPAEADAILARTTLDPNPVVVVDGQHFYLGTLGGKKVIVAMTGIGIVNATQTTETALDHFTPESGISIGAVVFSGVAGGSGRTEIGSVAVPARWTLDGGTTWHAVDPGMLAAANTLNVDLLSADTIGDPACLCSLLGGFLPIDLHREPQLFVGGDGSTSDNNNGTAFPAVPVVGGDIFGPEPYRAPDYSLFFPGNFFQAVVPWLAFGLFTNITGIFTNVPPAVDAADQETAAVQQVADAHGIPFLGVRGMSDGPGDPLNLPGYPFTFFVYKQLAADNSAIVTEGFLQNWAGPDSPPETTM